MQLVCMLLVNKSHHHADEQALSNFKLTIVLVICMKLLNKTLHLVRWKISWVCSEVLVLHSSEVIDHA